jgi:hypothetical protein
MQPVRIKVENQPVIPYKVKWEDGADPTPPRSPALLAPPPLRAAPRVRNATHRTAPQPNPTKPKGLRTS